MVKVKEFDHKSKMRIIVHGEIWNIVKNGDSSFNRSGETLLVSITTGYMKWWKNSHIFSLDSQ